MKILSVIIKSVPGKTHRQRGSAVVETALIFLPLVLMTFSTFEVARGMWMYHTLSMAIKTGARYATVHGADCLAAYSTCPATVSALATVIQQNGVGLDGSQLKLSLTAPSGTYTCASLATCERDATQWPPASSNSLGLPLTVKATYSFQSVISALWPGQAPASFTYVAEATENIQF